MPMPPAAAIQSYGFSAVTGQKLMRSKQSLHTPSSPLKTANMYNGLLVQVISARQGLVDRCCCRLPLHDDWPNGRQVMACSSLARSSFVMVMIV
jgi:hypothetical protein